MSCPGSFCRRGCPHREARARSPRCPVPDTLERVHLRAIGRICLDDLDGIHQTRPNCLYAVTRLPAIQAETEEPDGSIALEFLDRFTELSFIGPSIVPHVELEDIDGIGSELLANEVGVSKNVFGGKDVMISITRK